MTQDHQLQRLSVRYFSALHAAVSAHSTEEAAQQAKDLGDEALKLGLATPELTQIHQRALYALTPCQDDPETIQRLVARATVFFDATLASLGQQGLPASGRPWNQRDRYHSEAARQQILPNMTDKHDKAGK